MKVTMFQNNQTIRVTKINLYGDAKQRLLHVGVYEGAILHIEKKGRKGKPSLLLVCGNLLMLREKDLQQMEGEEYQ